MPLEAASAAGPQKAPDKKDGADVAKLVERYKERLRNSSVIFKGDKERLLKMLDSKPVHALKPADLAGNIAYIPTMEAQAKKDLADYGAMADKLNKKAGKYGLVLVAPEAKKKFLKWFTEQPYTARTEILSKPFFKEAERLQLLEDFKHLPRAERKARLTEINGLPGLEEKQAKVAAILKKHRELKAAFLKLPKEVQEKHVEAFKESTLDERAQLLASLKEIAKGEANEDKELTAHKEKAEKQRLQAEFRKQMQCDGVDKGLFSPESIEPNLLWLDSLPLAKQREAVEQKKSDLYLRMDERVDVRDRFLKLSPTMQAQHKERFSQFDLDRRIEFLDELEDGGNEKGRATAYPDHLVDRTLEAASREPAVADQLLIHNLLMTKYTLGQRAALRTNAVKQEDIARRTEERGKKVDAAETLWLTNLNVHRDQRQSMRRRLIEENKLVANQNAEANNITFLSHDQRMLSATEFRDTVIKSQKAELVAHVVRLAGRRLPGADRRTLTKRAEKHNYLVNMHALAA